jgi:SAM-dependent methyltransferase
MQVAFEKVYATNEWGHGSGEGSAPKHTRGYVKFLQQFLKQYQIRSVVDMGCGDWQFSRFIDWTGIHYRGYDLVRSVIENNQKHFAKPGIEFFRYEGNFDELPQADLLITKDVLQHLSQENIMRFLPTINRYPRCLITNCVNPHGPTLNKDIQDGEFRYLDLRLPPFGVTAEEVFEFTNHRPAWLGALAKLRWRKKVLLIDNNKKKAV